MEHPDEKVRDVLYPIVDERTLSDLVAEYRSSGPGYLIQVRKVIRASYGNHHRRMLPMILDALELRDLRAPTPLIYNHVNPYGIFELNMGQRIQIETAMVA